MKAEEISEKEEAEEEEVNKSQLRKDLFARFAYSPTSGSSTDIKLQLPSATRHETQITRGKRKVQTHEEDVDSPGIYITEPGTDKQDENSPKKARRTGTSKVKYYHHLKALDDCLAYGLDVVFCGINAGQRSAEIGHHYGNPTNHFWSCLHESGLTPERLEPKDDGVIASKYGIGLTNLCHRPSVQQNEIAREEFVQGVPILLDKLDTYRPKVMCFVGLGIADIFKAVAVNKSLEGTKLAKSKATLGLQPYKMVHTTNDGETSETIFYAVSSTSGRVVRYQKAEKIEQFKGIFGLLTKIRNNTFDSSRLTAFPPLISRTVAVEVKGEAKNEG